MTTFSINKTFNSDSLYAFNKIVSYMIYVSFLFSKCNLCTIIKSLLPNIDIFLLIFSILFLLKVHVYTYCYKCQKAWLDNTKHNGMGNQQSEKCQKYQTDEDINEEGTITTDADVHPICYQSARQHTNQTDVELGCSDHDGQAVDFPGIHLCCNFVSNIEEKAICDKIYETPFFLSQSGRRKQVR